MAVVVQCVCRARVCLSVHLHYMFTYSFCSVLWFLCCNFCILFIVSKLGFREFPYQIASQSTLVLRKWIFSTIHVSIECSLSVPDRLEFVQEAHITRKDSKVQEIIYQQAVEDVRQNRIDVENHSQELESLQLQERKDEVLVCVWVLVYCVLFLNVCVSIWSWSDRWSHTTLWSSHTVCVTLGKMATSNW